MIIIYNFVPSDSINLQKIKMAGALCNWMRTCPRLRTSSSMCGGIAQFISQKRTIVEKSKLKLDPDTYPEPWPYKEKGYALFFPNLSHVDLYACMVSCLLLSNNHHFLLFIIR